MTLGVGVEEIRKEDRAEENAVEGALFRRPVMTESGKETLDALELEGGWRCLMDGGRLDAGVTKGSLLGVVGRVAVVSAVFRRMASTRVSPIFERGIGVGLLSSVGCPVMSKLPLPLPIVRFQTGSWFISRGKKNKNGQEKKRKDARCGRTLVLD